MLPKFLIIGAEKAGTTSIYHYLTQNPEIFMPSVKEPHFFSHFEEDYHFIGPGRAATPPITAIEEYKSLFKKCELDKLGGEASPSYLHISGTAAKIKSILGKDIKLIVSLRNPVDRAFSNYLHNVRKGREKLSFEEALEKEDERIKNGWDLSWHYKTKGLYYEKLKEYFEVFDKKNILVIIFEEFKNDPNKTLSEMNGFLGIKSEFLYDVSESHSSSAIYKYKLFSFLGHIEKRVKNIIPRSIKKNLKRALLEKPALNSTTRKSLFDEYKNDVEKLKSLIEHDLTQWYQK